MTTKPRSRGSAVGIRIRQARESKQLSLEAVQERCNIDKSNLSKYERGQILPALPTLEKIAAAIGVPLTELVA